MIKLAIALGVTSLLFMLSALSYLIWSVALGQIDPQTPLPAAFSIPTFTAMGVFVFAIILGGVDAWVDQRARSHEDHVGGDVVRQRKGVS